MTSGSVKPRAWPSQISLAVLHLLPAAPSRRHPKPPSSAPFAKHVPLLAVLRPAARAASLLSITAQDSYDAAQHRPGQPIDSCLSLNFWLSTDCVEVPRDSRAPKRPLSLRGGNGPSYPQADPAWRQAAENWTSPS